MSRTPHRALAALSVAALALTVLGFILLGDALKDALDPKEQHRGRKG